MRKYRFVKLHCSHYNMDYPWILECTDLDTLKEHNEKYMSTEIESGIRNLLGEEDKKEHIKTNWGVAVKNHMLTNQALNRSTDVITSSLECENLVIQGKIRQLYKSGTLYLRENGSYMAHGDSISVTDVIETNEMVWPNYTEADIKIKCWREGGHYYAWIGRMEVMDESGKTKWSTPQEARRQAVKYLRKMGF